MTEGLSSQLASRESVEVFERGWFSDDGVSMRRCGLMMVMVME